MVALLLPLGLLHVVLLQRHHASPCRLPWPFKMFIYVSMHRWMIPGLTHAVFMATNYSGTAPCAVGPMYPQGFYCPESGAIQCYGQVGDQILTTMKKAYSIIDPNPDYSLILDSFWIRSTSCPTSSGSPTSAPELSSLFLRRLSSTCYEPGSREKWAMEYWSASEGAPPLPPSMLSAHVLWLKEKRAFPPHPACLVDSVFWLVGGWRCTAGEFVQTGPRKGGASALDIPVDDHVEERVCHGVCLRLPPRCVAV